jgi:hypothetical protein
LPGNKFIGQINLKNIDFGEDNKKDGLDQAIPAAADIADRQDIAGYSGIKI